MATTAERPTLLLAEPIALMRRTVATVARELHLADVREASSFAGADTLLRKDRFDALFIALDDDGGGIELIVRLRAGIYVSTASIPVTVMTAACDRTTAIQLKELAVLRVLLKPFKLKDVLTSIANLQC